MRYVIWLLTFLAAACPGCSKSVAVSSDTIPETHVVTKTAKNDQAVQDSFLSHVATYGDLVIKSENCFLGIVKLKDILGSISVSQDECFTIVLSIHNNNSTKKHEYFSWAGKRFSRKLDHATLTDNFGNSYKLITFSLGSKLLGAVDEYEAVYPEKTLEDRLVFETPLDNATYLDLHLPAENIGGKGIIKLRIPLKSKDQALKDKQDKLQRDAEENAAQLEATKKRVEEARLAALEKAKQEREDKERQQKIQEEKAAAIKAKKDAEENARLEKMESEKKQLKMEAERKVNEDKASELLKAAKRWIAEDTASGRDIAITRLKDLLKRFPNSEAAKEGRIMLDKITKKN